MSEEFPTIEEQREMRRKARELCNMAAKAVALMPPWKRNILEQSGKSTLPVPRQPVGYEK